MTLIVGILCEDGVVLASDSAATYSAGAAFTIGQQEVTKVHRLGNDLVYASTGAIGVSQLIIAELTGLSTNKYFTKNVTALEVMKTLSRTIAEQVKHLFESAQRLVPLVGQNEAAMSVLCKSLVGAAVRKEPVLYQFDYGGAPEQATEKLPFIALGSGQAMADPYLAFLRRILWKDRRPTVAEGRLVAAWTIRHVSQTAVGFVGGPIQLATLAISDGVPSVELADPAEHDGSIEEAEAALRDYFRRRREGPAPAPPKPPLTP
jgi:20S proteasome alpha/beta subunit